MRRKYRHTWTLTIAAALLLASAFVVSIIIPRHFETRELNHLDDRARMVGSALAAELGEALLTGDESAFEKADSRLHSIRDFLGFVVVDRNQRVISSVDHPLESGAQDTISGADRIESGDRLPRATVTIPLGSDGVGTLYISMSRSGVQRSIRNDRKSFLGFGALLLFLTLLVLSAILGVGKAEAWSERILANRHDLERTRDELQERVDSHSRVEKELREREERYRFLLENAMESTFSDLEQLNDDLQIQKTDLEREVAAKTKAKNEARLSSERLLILNHIGRSIMENKDLTTIVELALDKLHHIVPFDRGSVVELDEWRGHGQIMAVRTVGTTQLESGTRKPLSYFRASGLGEKESGYVTNLSEEENPGELDLSLIDEGINSYYLATLMNTDQVVGSLNIGSNKKDAFREEEIQIIRDVADLLSIAISQSRHSEDRDRYESELILERDRAEEMARLKSAFLANMSHEIRTPLSGIIGFAQVLQEELSGEMEEFSSLIQQSARRLLTTINSVLDFAKLEADQVPIRMAPTEVLSSVRDTVRLLQPLAQEKNLDLRVLSSREEIVCHLDEARFERIVTNLVGNAIKFTESGSVEVSLEETETCGILYVKDTGIGISEEFLPKLFDEFHQEEMGSDRSHEGSGLGLAITRRLVEKMKGTIDVDSQKGKGTTFRVSFPLSGDVDEEHGKIDGIGSVLVISSNGAEEGAEWELLGNVIEVHTAPDLGQALEEARQRRFDLLIVDTDGIDPIQDTTDIQAIRDIPDYNDVAFIAVSSQALGEFEEQYLKTEFDGIENDPEGITSYLRRLFERLRYDERKRAERRASTRKPHARKAPPRRLKSQSA